MEIKINQFKKIIITGSLPFLLLGITLGSSVGDNTQCEPPKPNYGSCGGSAFHDVKEANKSLCNPGSTPIGSAQGKDGPRSWQCKGNDKTYECPKGVINTIPGVIRDCKANALGTMTPGRLTLEIPIKNGLQSDIVAKQAELNSENSKESLKGFFRILNEWMWMLLMLVLFIAVIYAGYTLITSVGDSDKMKTGLRMLLYIVFGLVIAILSWAVISLIAGMFA